MGTHSREVKSSSTYNLNVRSFQPKDAEAVLEICRTHFRSLSVPAVKYYILEHFRDLVALLVIGKIFQSWTDLLLADIIFLIYLFIRARVEMELYIRRDCPDLDDVINYYCVNEQNSRSHFWVAEASPKRKQSPTTNNNEEEKIKSPVVVGCVGCCPTRDDPNVAQLVRLVVAEDARRMRNGSRLLAQFENFAIEKDYREVRLYTNNLNTTHMKFIRQRGYEIVYWVSRTLMRGSLIQWKKILKPTMTSIQPIGLNITSQDSSGAETPLVSTNESSSIAESRRRSNTIVVMD